MQKNNLSLERITFVRENRKKRFFDLNIFEFWSSLETFVQRKYWRKSFPKLNLNIVT